MTVTPKTERTELTVGESRETKQADQEVTDRRIDSKIIVTDVTRQEHRAGITGKTTGKKHLGAAVTKLNRGPLGRLKVEPPMGTHSRPQQHPRARTTQDLFGTRQARRPLDIPRSSSPLIPDSEVYCCSADVDACQVRPDRLPKCIAGRIVQLFGRVRRSDFPDED